MESRLLAGKYALVTGGAAGIGLAISRSLAREGAQVLIVDVNADQGSDAVAGINANGGQATFQHCDVTDAKQVRRVVNQPERLDCVVNNAGLAGPYCNITEVEEHQLDALMAVNVKGVFFVTQAAVERMRASGGGAIVNVASVGGVAGTAGLIPYTMSKHAVIGLTRGVAVEQSGHGIRINAVCPGPTRTAMIEDYATQNGLTIADLESNLPLGRISKPQEVADAVVWLCSDKSSATTGSLLMVDGGYTAQ